MNYFPEEVLEHLFDFVTSHRDRYAVSLCNASGLLEKVAVKCRPLTERERGRDIVRVQNNKEVLVLDPDISKDYLDRIQNRTKERRYTFDYAFVSVIVCGNIYFDLMGLNDCVVVVKQEVVDDDDDAVVVKSAGLDISDIGLFEINETFASQFVYCCKKLGLDTKKVNVNDGAIALGHPLGATGARCVATLLHGMKRRGKDCRY
ncbi:3-ketoacyl-coa thiolase 5 peroxisomal [Phtheirospermum japonicum]|uniref:3-ketoacyl-coa thiolase 5 peroxisomal n=1 Tax=Phtheirospermum japonicum TaxID=374723 RepID=A0A830BT84_9LAMI|nr:3-ketoacyl-coa thiolase 5 peroxisomal [Phtheirospermum japonicum]